MIKLIIADDHKLLIDGLRPLIEKLNDIEIVSVAHDGIEVVQQAMTHKPDIIIMDISMPKLNGIDATRKILRDLPNTKVIILSMHADQRYIQESLRAGAVGYILKESAANEVNRAIAAVRNGEIFFSDSVRDKVIHQYLNWIKEKEEATDSPLSVREREVLQLLAEGKSTKEIAEYLNVSIKTVETHRKQVMDKLDLHSIAELTKYAIKAGITQL